MEPLHIPEGITFDDVLLVPQRSGVTPDATDTSTRLTRRISLNIPLLSAPMDTVTEGDLAVALAQEGGLGVIHKNLDPASQAREVSRVKRCENGIITDPVTLSPSDTVGHATELMAQHGVSGFPVTMDGTGHGVVAGILTRRDISFVEAGSAFVGDVMTKDNLVTASPGIDLQAAEQAMNRGRVEKLLLLDDGGALSGLITMRDIENVRRHPMACRDERGRLRVGAAVGVLDPERVDALVAAEVDCITVDTAHGHSENVIKTVRDIKSRHDIDVIAGNIATREAAADLIEAGADAVKVGIGPGSICTTRIISGVGVPQLSAIADVCLACSESDVPVIADGGVRQSGDIAKAIGFGAECVMLGSLFAGLDESPGELIIHGGRRFKAYRGMGSIGAMGRGSADRYGQGSIQDRGKFVPEGVEGRVPYRGTLAEFVYQMVGGLRSAMGYCGCGTISQLRERARFVRVSGAGLVESHAHDIHITKEAPNYSLGAGAKGG
ncbi:MAG: IMP dehydrogenase [Phycisphaerales bacterium]|nr:IMP dehydrogenase [Phycisphaerales bacterium]